MINGCHRYQLLIHIGILYISRVIHVVTDTSGQFSVTGLTAGVDYLLNISAMTPVGVTDVVTLTALTSWAQENRIGKIYKILFVQFTIVIDK